MNCPAARKVLGRSAALLARARAADVVAKVRSVSLAVLRIFCWSEEKECYSVLTENL